MRASRQWIELEKRKKRKKKAERQKKHWLYMNPLSWAFGLQGEKEERKRRERGEDALDNHGSSSCCCHFCCHFCCYPIRTPFHHHMQNKARM
jgi:hypothetical protein